MKKVLLGTRNKTRKEYVKEILKDLEIEIFILRKLRLGKLETVILDV